jgi:hypothetical protein
MSFIIDQADSKATRCFTPDFSLWQALDLSHGPDFDGSDPRSGNPPSDLDCVIEIHRINQEVTTDLFPGFGERAISHYPFAVANSNAGRL